MPTIGTKTSVGMLSWSKDDSSVLENGLLSVATSDFFLPTGSNFDLRFSLFFIGLG
jgi:hypothetical protein